MITPKTARAFAFAAVILVALLAACSRNRAAPMTASRVVSLSPSTTETMFAIGAGALLVGRSRFCNYPADALRLPQVGGYVDPSFEAILALRPDLVVGARGPAGPAITDKLEAKGIATFFPPTESIAQIEQMISGLGERTQHVADAKRVIDGIRARIAAIEGAISGAARPRVLWVVGLEPIVVVGPGSFADEVLRRAGGTNVVTEGDAYATVGMEHVTMLDPDVVLDASIMEGQGKPRIRVDSAGWANLRAVKGGRVVSLADEVVLRPGPRIAEGLAMVARALHPDRAIP